MLDLMRLFVASHPLLALALANVWGAVLVDLAVFAKAKTPGDFFGQWRPSVALWRYAQSFVGGFLGTALVAGGTSVIALWMLGGW